MPLIYTFLLLVLCREPLANAWGAAAPWAHSGFLLAASFSTILGWRRSYRMRRLADFLEKAAAAWAAKNAR